jgi:hypothetical protein
MATGINADGKVVSANDQVTIMGSVDAVSGSGGSAVVTVIPLRALAAGGISCKANDMNAAGIISGNALSIAGKPFGVGDRVSVLGTVTSVSGSGADAVLTVTLCTSGNSVTVPAGSVHSLQFNG